MRKYFLILACCVCLAPLPVTAAAGDAAILSGTGITLALAVIVLLILVGWLWFKLAWLQREKKVLIARAERAEQIVNHAPIPILCCDPDLTVVSANLIALQNHDQSAVLGCKLDKLQSTIAAWSTPHAAAAIMDSEDGNFFDPRRADQVEDLTPISIEGKPYLLWYGVPPETNSDFFTNNDVAVLAEESASRMKSDFIANINHEVRTPMNAIIGYTEMLANSELGPKEKRFVAIIHKSSMALVSIFNDIMELSKIDSGRLQIMASTVQLHPIISEVEGLFKDLAEEKGLTLQCRVARHLPKAYVLDGVRLKQILQNLLSNAIKFTYEGVVILSVDGKPTDKASDCFDLRFIVKDTGVGISEADQEKIVELFEQREASTKQYGGVGLGLTLCSRLAVMMGGRIELLSKEKEGAQFTVFLPGIRLGRQDVDTPKIDQGQIASEQERKLLVVDDVDLIKDVFLDYFQNSLNKVLTAKNGEEALAIALAEHPDLIFMDLNLTGMNGRSVTEQLRQNPSTADIPVIVMTGDVLDEGDYRPLFNDLLQKPFRLEVLDEIVQRYAASALKGTPSPPKGGEENEKEQLLSLQRTGAWNKALEALRVQTVFSGGLADAATLGEAMVLRGEDVNQPLLVELGRELLSYAHEPNILGVDRLLAKLSNIANGTEQ